MIKSMFTNKGIKGLILNRTLHRQHRSVYRYNRATAHGRFEQPCTEMTAHFLDLVHYGLGNRIFTYVITLDSLMRFTETGKEFGIDFLSKHTMHSDVSVYVAYSGEFFVRERAKRRNHQRKQSGAQSTRSGKTPTSPMSPTSPKSPRSPKPRIFSLWRWKEVKTAAKTVYDGPSRDPAQYELVIDNDSGTYRPSGKLLPQLKMFLEHNFPGLNVVTLDSQADAELMNRLKGERRERKRAGRHQMVYRQFSNLSNSSSSSSSISSSDEEELAVAADEFDNTAEGDSAIGQVRGGGAMTRRQKRSGFNNYIPRRKKKDRELIGA